MFLCPTFRAQSSGPFLQSIFIDVSLLLLEHIVILHQISSTFVSLSQVEPPLVDQSGQARKMRKSLDHKEVGKKQHLSQNSWLAGTWLSSPPNADQSADTDEQATIPTCKSSPAKSPKHHLRFFFTFYLARQK